MGKMTIDEVALEIFPDEIFRKDFQKELDLIYNGLIAEIAKIKNPASCYGKSGWYLLYKIGFCSDDKFSLAFTDGTVYLNGVIEVIPDREPILDVNEILVKNDLIFVPAGIQPMSFKYFQRQIRFIDLKRKDLILKYLQCDPIVLNEAEKRFPENGLLAIEINKILKPAYVVKPSGYYFPKLLKFSDKIRRIIKEIEVLENF